MMALAKMVPDKVFASSDGGNTGISIGGYHADHSPFIYVDFTCCAWGGRPYADGLDGNSNMFANMASQPIEVTEQEQPMQIIAYEFLADAMGAGIGTFGWGGAASTIAWVDPTRQVRASGFVQYMRIVERVLLGPIGIIVCVNCCPGGRPTTWKQGNSLKSVLGNEVPSCARATLLGSDDVGAAPLLFVRPASVP